MRENLHENEAENTSNSFCEIDNENCAEGNCDTLVEEANLDTNKVYVFAPGEN